jgi:hypothetical protein
LSIEFGEGIEMGKKKYFLRRRFIRQRKAVICLRIVKE